MKKLEDEISEKRLQIHRLEERMFRSVDMSHHTPNFSEMSQVSTE